VAGREIKLLLDTGTSKNYITPLPGLKGIVAADKPFTVKSIHGFTKINKKCLVSVFNVKTPFFILNDLKDFNGIIGLDLQVNAKLDFTGNVLHTSKGTEKIQFTKAENVNFIKIDDEDVPPAIKITFDKMIVKNHKAFADPDEALPFNINTLATIKTDGEPVYSRSYPHPMGVTEFVNAEVKQLLADGVIRPSKSPYNNPTWVVDKKGTDQNGVKKKRLVIDFRKLNQKT